MLGRLIKHEFRATARIMLPVMGALAALALLANLSMRGLADNITDVPILRVFLVLIVVFYGIAIVAAAVMAVVLMVTRFYRNLLKDEGYLMFTLPVSVHELIWAKLIVSLVWFTATGLLICLLIALTGLNLSASNLEMILRELPSRAEIRQMLDGLGIRGLLNTMILQGVLGVLLGSVSTCLHFYAAMSLGHMFTKNKVLLSVVFYVLISFAFNFVNMGFGLVSFGPDTEIAIDEVKEGMQFASGLIRHGLLLSAVQSAVLYLVTVLGLRRGLNLE